MPVPSKPLPTLGQANSTEDPRIRDVLQELQALLTAGIDTGNLNPGFTLDGAKLTPNTVTVDKLTTALADILGYTTTGVGGVVRRGAASAAAEVTTSLGTPQALAGGPSFTVTQPASGATFVAVQADVKGVTGAIRAQVDLFCDGAPLIGTLLNPPGSLAYATSLINVATVDKPGQHTYELRYKASPANNQAWWQNRKLWVWTVGF